MRQSLTRECLILVAHADDETLGAGGLIQKLAKANWKVKVVIVSDGLVSVRGVIQDNRPGTRAACKLFGLEEPVFLDFKDQRFDTVAIADIANAVFQLGFEPDLIVSHVETDLNLDHRIVADVAKIVARPKKKPISLIGCEIPSTTFWNAEQFRANYFVDITQELETKIAAFTKYENEIQAFPHPWSEKGLRLLAEYHGMLAGYHCAEGFYIYRAYEGLLP